MMKLRFLLLVIFFATSTKAQQFSLTHSGTLYDSFENPVQPAFTIQKSKKYNISILPHLNGNFRFVGNAENTFKSILFGNEVSSSGIKNISDINNIQASVNTYLFMFKIFHTAEYQREMGISLQLRNEGTFNLSNTALAIPYSFSFLGQGTYNNYYTNVHNNIAFWQLGFSYRENYNSKIAFGAKLSYLSGAAYSDMHITSSRLRVENRYYNMQMAGSYTSSYGTDGLSIGSVLPNFKNPGFALSLGTSYTFKNKIYLTANLKDAGIIFWSSKTPQYTFIDEFEVKNLDKSAYKNKFYDGFNAMLKEHESTSGSFYTLLNSSAEIAASKKFNNYKPVIVASKNLTNNDGFVALQNNYIYRSLNVALNASYHLNNGFNIGNLLMLKSDNAEFFMGTERLISTYNLTKGYIKKDETIGKSPTQMDIFLGLNIKFGRRVQTIGFADFVDGLNDPETGYVYRLSKKEKRALKKERPKKGGRRRN